MKCKKCANPSKARGFCHYHYNKERASGNLQIIKNVQSNKCSIEFCNNRPSARNLCKKHYARFRKGKPVVKLLDKSEWTPENIAWLAGIIEGEGTFTIRKQNNHTTIKIVSTDFDVIEKINSIVGTGKINGPYKRSDNRKFFKVWSLHESFPQKELMQMILPWMGKRRSKRIKQCLKLLDKALVTSKNPYK